jgi:hypothetical protein
MLQLCYKYFNISMFLATQFDKHINGHYNMNVVNQNKSQIFTRGQGDEIRKRKENE